MNRLNKVKEVCSIFDIEFDGQFSKVFKIKPNGFECRVRSDGTIYYTNNYHVAGTLLDLITGRIEKC